MMFELFVHREPSIKAERYILNHIRDVAERFRIYPDELILINSVSDIVLNSIARNLMSVHHMVVPPEWDINQILHFTNPTCFLTFADIPWHEAIPDYNNRILIP